MNFVLDYVRKNPVKYQNLRDSLKASRMEVPYTSYVKNAVLNSIGVALIAAIVLFLFPRFSSIPLLSDIEFLYSMSETLSKIPYSQIFFLILPPVIALITFKGYLMYPSFNAMSRKTRIDIVLPHAAAFCYGMSKGGSPIYEIFKDLAKNQNIYGEVSREMAYIVRDVELLGKDASTAIRNVSRTSPSEKFQDFLENLIPMFESGSNIEQYFEVKMNQYFEHAKKTQEMFLQTLEMIAEVYVVAFVATPIFLLVTLVSGGLMNMNQSSYLFTALYVGLPMGSIALIFIIDAISPKEDLGMTYVNKIILRSSDYELEDTVEDQEYEEKLKHFERLKEKKKIWKYAKNPFPLIYQKPLRAAFISALVIPLPFLFTEYAFDKQVMLAIIGALAPVSLAYEYKSRKLTKLDQEIPDFLRRLAEMNEIGMGLKGAIGMFLKSDIGLLSGEIRRMWLDMEWGSQMKDALVKFENRIGTPALRRAVTLIAKASEVNDNTKDVLLIASEDAANIVSLRKERFQSGFVYLSTVYIAFGTFLYVCYSFSTKFLPAVGAASLANIGEITSTMFITCGVLGFFSGIITGQMAEGKILYGLKHALVFLTLTYVLFVFTMGY